MKRTSVYLSSNLSAPQSLIIFFLLFCAQSKSFAAACCGGGIAIPSIIAGDEKYQLATSLSTAKIFADVAANGVWQKRTNDDLTRILKLDMAAIFSDRYQYGVSIPIHERQVSGELGGSSHGLGDTAVQLGYEYLPDWDYSPYRPKGIGYLNLTLPTGKSLYEEDNFSGLESRGRGFWALGVGTLLTKNFKKWDTLATLDLHKSFSKKVSNSQFDGRIEPGWGYSYSLGLGYNWGDFRFGHAISWSHEDGIQTIGNISSIGSAQDVATGSISFSYLIEDLLSSSIVYSDQTWYGNPSNTGLNKTILLTLVKRWSR